MTGALPAPSTVDGWPADARIVEFRESLRGVVRWIGIDSIVDDDRLECALAVENATADPAGLRGCVLDDLRIALDAGSETADGGLAGVVRSGTVLVEGFEPLAVRHGEFELFPRVPGDGRRLRYRLWLRDPGGAEWFLRGTKLVVNEAGRGRLGAAWAETTTLFVVLVPAADGPGAYTGVVRLGLVDFVRQLATLRAEPGPAGGCRAVGRLAAAFWSALADTYLGGGSEPFAPGIEAAFAPSAISGQAPPPAAGPYREVSPAQGGLDAGDDLARAAEALRRGPARPDPAEQP